MWCALNWRQAEVVNRDISFFMELSTKPYHVCCMLAAASYRMNFAETDNHPAEDSASGQIDALIPLINLARMSRLNLLHYRRDQAHTGSRLLLQAARQRGGNEIAVLFDEWDGAPLAMLQQRLDEAVHAADPGAMPYFGDLPGALAHWQHAQGLRFFVILYGFERHLARNADASDVAEFDRALIRLASDPMLELHILLCIEEESAPLLDRLRPFLPDLGQEYLRMPESPGTEPRQAAMGHETAQPDADASPVATPSAPAAMEPTSAAPESGASAHGEPTLPILPLQREVPGVGALTDRGQGIPVDDPHPESARSGEHGADATDFTYRHKPQRRRRDFSSLLETLNAAPLARAPGTSEPQGTQGASKAPAQAMRAEQPMRVSPWFHDRTRQRRLTSARLATNGILTATAILFVLLIIGMLAWTLQQASVPASSESDPVTSPATRVTAAQELQAARSLHDG